MTEEDIEDTTEEPTRSDDSSDEESVKQDGGGGFLSSITGYFSGTDGDNSADQTQPIDESGPSPADTGAGEPQTEPADEFAEPADEFAEPADEFAEPADEGDQPFTDLIGEDEGEQTEADQTVDSVEATDTAAGEAAGEPLQEGLDDVPDPRESPGDIEPDAEDEDDLLESDEDSEDPFAEMEGAFEEMDVESVEPDEVWTDVSEAEQQAAAQGGAERTYAEVSKHAFCQQCEYFSPPPEANCSHDGTEIVEFTDMENVRVVDCPIVAERRGLEEGMHSAFDSTDEEPEPLEMDEVGELEE